MAARDILNLGTPMADGIIRLLYTIALILIGLGTLFGIGRGVMILTHAPMQRPAITSNATPPGQQQNAPQEQSNAAPQAQPGTDNGMRRDFRFGPRGDYRGWHRWGHHRGYFGMMPRSPWFGLVVIVGALLRGLIALLIVRVMAEIGLAVLSKRAASA